MLNVKYPAIFHLEDKSYWVEFPDLEGCFSSGDSMEEAYENAKDALGVYLDKDGDLYSRKINKPSDINKVIAKHKKDIVMFVDYNSVEYAKKFKNKAIKKTLSIPEWLNDLAIEKNINFSNLLQEALLNKISKTD